ncbi:MAG TPA: hypothetical protein VF060_14745 [Trebonia sp.]
MSPHPKLRWRACRDRASASSIAARVISALGLVLKPALAREPDVLPT